MKRVRYTVAYSKKLKAWQVKKSGRPVAGVLYKKDAIRIGAAYAHTAYERDDILTELIVMGHGKRGVTDNRTYGRDSRRTKG